MTGVLALDGDHRGAAKEGARTEQIRDCGVRALAIRETGDKLLVFDAAGRNLIVWAPIAPDGRVTHRAFFNGLNSDVQMEVDPRQEERHVRFVFEAARCSFAGVFPPAGSGTDAAGQVDQYVALRRD